MVWLLVVIIAALSLIPMWWTRNSRPRVVARTLERVWQRLRSAHGMKDFYEGSEVAAALKAAAVTDGDIVPFAFARYCRETDFLAEPACRGLSYRQLREQMLQGSRSAHPFPRRTPNV